MLKRTFLSATAVALMLATPAFAQTAGDPMGKTGEQPTPPVAERPRTEIPVSLDERRGTVLLAEKATQIRAEKLIGMKVVNGQGDELGTVDDIVLNEDGTMSGIILRTGDVLGIGGKSVAVAWQDVGSAIRSDAVSLPLSKEQIEKAPAYERRDDKS